MEIEYQELFNRLVTLLETPQQVAFIKKELQTEGYNQQILDEVILYLINQQNITVIEDSLLFDKKVIHLSKTPQLLFKTNNQTEDELETQIVLSFPPFNYYTLETRFSKDKIAYIQQNTAFRKIFEKAKEEIWICSPFFDFKGINYFSNILVKKLEKGVVLNILTRPSQTNEIKALLSRFKEDIGKLVRVRMYHFGKGKRVLSGIHAKLVGADTTLCYLGSGEIRKNSFSKNLEIGILSGPPLSIHIRNIFNSIFSLASEGTNYS